MKNYLLLFGALLSLHNLALCQFGYSINPESFEESYDEDLASSFNFLHKAYMENSSDSILNINWELVNIDVPTEWQLSVSDKNIGYIPGITNNQIPLEFEPGEIDIPFNVDLYHNQTPGCGSFEVIITLAVDATIIDTIEYDISINDDDCIVSNILSTSISNGIQLLPNPFTDNLFVNSESIVDHVRLYSYQGQAVYKEIVLSKGPISLELSKLNSGLYFIELVLSNGERVIKKAIKE